MAKTKVGIQGDLKSVNVSAGRRGENRGDYMAKGGGITLELRDVGYVDLAALLAMTGCGVKISIEITYPVPDV